MADFEIVHDTREVPYTHGNRVRRVFYPTEEHNCAIVYIEANAGAGAAIMAKLAEIEALSTEFKMLQWQADAIADRRPSVDVRAVVRDNAPLP